MVLQLLYQSMQPLLASLQAWLYGGLLPASLHNFFICEGEPDSIFADLLLLPELNWDVMTYLTSYEQLCSVVCSSCEYMNSATPVMCADQSVSVDSPYFWNEAFALQPHCIGSAGMPNIPAASGSGYPVHRQEPVAAEGTPGTTIG